jgi:low affinity Fe/Cu permease
MHTSTHSVSNPTAQARPKEYFRNAARVIADLSGSPSAFVLACSIVAGWLLVGPHFHYSDTWQLVINTATTIITFLMVFLIQNTQNRDTREIHLKLDELIRSHEPARNLFMNLERLSDQELDELAQKLAVRQFRPSTDKPPPDPMI